MEFASTLLPKLAKLLHDEYNLQKGARKGIEFLYSELETMHAALRKIGEVPREQLGEQQKIWARDVRELSYDMDDIVDTFLVDVEGPQPPSKRGAKKMVKKLIRKLIRKVTKVMARREVAQEIKDIKERVKELAERRDRYKLDAIAPANKTTIDPRLHALYTKPTEIVGIEEAKEEVIARLKEGGDADHLERIVVSIAGFGGLGKTTLAKAVYDEIKEQFDCTAFISVSRTPDPTKLLKNMLYALDKKKFKDIHSTMLEEMHLVDLVHEFLQKKRYLVVIDDIWDKKPWDNVIMLALKENNMRSRIITTTRNIGVAEHVGGCYRLKPLSDEVSEILFYGRIFGSKEKCPMELSEVSKNILKKCGGVPLAIVTTSSLLANKSDDTRVRVWNDVCNSIGSGIGTNAGMEDMGKILLLSYYDLPSHLKTCLLYLSIFPEDFKIRKDRLMWRWVAEGFVQKVQKSVGDQTFYEIGESYFNELLNRSLIQPADMDDVDGTPNACRVHDAVLDLILLLSREECFVATEMESKVRRLSLHNSATCPTMTMPKLRSLTIFPPAGVVIDPTPSISCYLLLRVLDLQGCEVNDLTSLLRFVGSLSHLRYLALPSSSSSRTGQLPVEIGKLRFLQTLDLSQTKLKELPLTVIRSLEQLMCLRGCGGRGTRLPDGLKNLTSLEVLKDVVVTSKCTAEELGHLTQLRVLEVDVTLSKEASGDELRACREALLESLCKLTKCERLHIGFYTYAVNLNVSMVEPLGNLHWLRAGAFVKLPTWIRPTWLPALSYLNIRVIFERRDDIQVLGTLPCLRNLILTVEKEGAVERCAVGADAFPRVVSCEFEIREGAGVLPCMFPRGAMPMLQDYKFNIGCEQLASLAVEDMGLGHLPSLQSVTVHGLVHFRGDDKALEDKANAMMAKLEQEGAAHPNQPVRITYLVF